MVYPVDREDEDWVEVSMAYQTDRDLHTLRLTLVCDNESWSSATRWFDDFVLEAVE